MFVCNINKDYLLTHSLTYLLTFVLLLCHVAIFRFLISLIFESLKYNNYKVKTYDYDICKVACTL